MLKRYMMALKGEMQRMQEFAKSQLACTHGKKKNPLLQEEEALCPRLGSTGGGEGGGERCAERVGGGGERGGRRSKRGRRKAVRRGGGLG